MNESMNRPENPYRKGSLIWSVMEGGLQGEFDGLPGWEDLTLLQVGEVLDSCRGVIQKLVRQIKSETGYTVPHFDGRSKRQAL